MAGIFVQTAGRVGDNDNADPDNCTFGGVHSVRYNQAKLTPFHIRGQITNSGDQGGGLWKCRYNDVNSRSTGVVVGAALNGTIQVDSVGGLPADGATVGTPLCGIPDGFDAGDWQTGLYDEVDGIVGKFQLAADHFMECQFCVQFTELALDGQRYYFWVMANNGLSDVTGLIRVETPALGGPKGALGHPLNGSFRGPI